MAAAAMAHANPVVRGSGGCEAGPGLDPAARSRARGLRKARGVVGCLADRPSALQGGKEGMEIASPSPGPA